MSVNTLREIVRRWAQTAASVVVITICAVFTQAQPAGGPLKEPSFPVKEMTVDQAERESARLTKAYQKAFADKNFAEASSLLEELIPIEPQNFVNWYNLSCALALSGNRARAVTMLEQAVARGYSDIEHLKADPDLAPIREEPGYRAIIESWSARQAQSAARRIDRLKAQYKVDQPGSKYRAVTDDRLRLVFINAFEPTVFGLAKDELVRLSDWWAKDVLPERDRAAALSGERHASQAIVSVLLPTRPDYAAWAIPRFGSSWDRVGGAYMHDERALVSMDLGSSLRHEFWHVLHWRDMELRKQRHPIWIMEGLCSVVEDIDTGPKGEMIIRPSWRTNITRRLAVGSGGLTPWATLFAMENQRFMRERPLAMYAQSRSVFEFLAQRGKLRDWYTAYVDNFAQERTGSLAMEKVFGKPVKDVEREFRAWARALVEVEAEIGRMAANLPVDVEPGQGDGVLIAGDDIAELFKPARGGGAGEPAENAEANRGSLKVNDVITAINGKPVRDVNDLVRVLGQFEAGQTVEVAVRRRTKALTSRVVLVSPR